MRTWHATDAPRPQTREQLLAMIHSQEDLEGADLRGLDLAGMDLAGLNLAGANLTGTRLAGADLSRTRLDGALLAGSDAEGANFDHASAVFAIFGLARLSNASFRAADLRRSNFVGTDAAGTDFSEANLYYARLAMADLTRSRFESANLDRAVMRAARPGRSGFGSSSWQAQPGPRTILVVGRHFEPTLKAQCVRWIYGATRPTISSHQSCTQSVVEAVAEQRPGGTAQAGAAGHRAQIAIVTCQQPREELLILTIGDGHAR